MPRRKSLQLRIFMAPTGPVPVESRFDDYTTSAPCGPRRASVFSGFRLVSKPESTGTGPVGRPP
jgi:hypothetical protein